MKKIIHIILFTIFVLFSTNIFASEPKYNTDSNIKKALLVEDYIIRHKEKIKNIIIKYNIDKNSSINKNVIDLDKSISILKKIQNNKIDKDIAGKVIQAILSNIKSNNESLKLKLEIEKQKFEKKLNEKKLSYSNLGFILSKKIDEINIKIATNIFKNKRVLSLKESRIKLSLINLNKESIKLKNFGNKIFSSEKEIKNSFIKILSNIRNNIRLIKKQLK